MKACAQSTLAFPGTIIDPPHLRVARRLGVPRGRHGNSHPLPVRNHACILSLLYTWSCILWTCKHLINAGCSRSTSLSRSQHTNTRAPAMNDSPSGSAHGLEACRQHWSRRTRCFAASSRQSLRQYAGVCAFVVVCVCVCVCGRARYMCVPTPAEPAQACLLGCFAEQVHGHCLPAGVRGTSAGRVLRAPAQHTKETRQTD